MTKLDINIVVVNDKNVAEISCDTLKNALDMALQSIRNTIAANGIDVSSLL